MAGLLGAATVNPLMARQFANARQNVTAPTSVMDERYPAWKKSQDQADQFLLAADLIGSAVPAGLLAAPAMKKGLLSMGETLGPPVKRGLLDFADTAAPKIENYMERNGMLSRITAYHGSPHRFDKFDASKIGTGEGAQAYGHGVYLAESPKVAQEYMKVSPSVIPPQRRAFMGQELEPGTWEYKAASLLDGNKSIASVKKEVSGWIQNARPGEDIEGYKKVLDTLSQATSKADFKKLKNQSYLYTVDLPDPMIAKMLDWDKPLSQQAPEVQKALGEIDVLQKLYPLIQAAPDVWRGEGIHKLLVQEIDKLNYLNKTNPQVLAADLLKSKGISGLRYLDEGSRAAGAGTSNFVVFPGNEQLVKILSRE